MKERYNKIFGSHLPLLSKVMNNTSGPVLELGTGMFSTPFLHWLCFDRRRFLVSYENDREFWGKYRLFQNTRHRIRFVEKWEDAKIENINWSVVLVDQHPARSRKEMIKRLVNIADFIVIHDTEPENNRVYHYEEIWPLFKFRCDDKRTKPNTSVVSNLGDFTWMI